MSKHTPGPWMLENTRTCGFRIVHGEIGIDGFRDDVPFGWGKIAPTDEEQANTRLAIAAPEMLNALREAEAGLELAVARLDKGGNKWPAASERLALRIAREAIAKATGGAS